MAGDFSIGSEVWPGVSKLIEEMGELNQVLGKLIGSGGEEQHWDGTNLRLRLQEELGDVKAAIAFLEQANQQLDGATIFARVQEKNVRFWRWHLEEQERG